METFCYVKRVLYNSKAANNHCQLEVQDKWHTGSGIIDCFFSFDVFQKLLERFGFSRCCNVHRHGQRDPK